MKQFLEDNLAIVAAIVLPVILVLVFAVSRAVTDRMVADPQYDFLIATNVYGGSNEAFYFDVVQERLNDGPLLRYRDLEQRAELVVSVQRVSGRDAGDDRWRDVEQASSNGQLPARCIDTYG